MDHGLALRVYRPLSTKSKEAATSLSKKNKSEPKSATTASGCYGLTASIMPRQWLTSTRRCGRSNTFSVPPNRSLKTESHLPQARCDHSRPCVLQFPGLSAQAGIGEPHETSRTGMGMERGHSRAGCSAAGRRQFERADAFYSAASLARTLRKQSAPRAWRYRLLCANSSDSVRAGNVVPKHFWHYVSPSMPTT